MGGRIKELWRKTSWTWSPESDRESSEAIVKNFWLHWFPAKVARASMDWNYSFWLGTSAASLLLILTVTAGPRESSPLRRHRDMAFCHRHVVETRGDATGPEVTYEGDRNPELFNFAHVYGNHTFFNWNVQHLTKASAISPNTAMPDFNFKPAESRALTLLMLSWRRLTFPPEYIPDPEVAAAAMRPSPTATPIETPAATPIPR